jgi:hypothetical protein
LALILALKETPFYFNWLGGASMRKYASLAGVFENAVVQNQGKAAGICCAFPNVP